MRFLWIDAGNDPDWATIKTHGMTGLYFALSDPLPDIKRRLEEAQGKGYQIGVFACWNWGPYTETDGVAFAEWVDARLRALVAAGYVSTVNRPRVQLNNERQEPGVILSMLRRWRQLRPQHSTSWALEGMQGGWMDAAFVKSVIGYKARVVPQAYNGAMTQQWDALAVARDLTARGFPDSIISPFYDALTADVQYAKGFFFTQGRLP